MGDLGSELTCSQRRQRHLRRPGQGQGLCRSVGLVVLQMGSTGRLSLKIHAKGKHTELEKCLGVAPTWINAGSM